MTLAHGGHKKKSFHRRRGNPNWGKSPQSALPIFPTEFENMCAKLGLRNDEEIYASEALKAWAHRHLNNRYIPESLLKSWHMDVDIRLTSLELDVTRDMVRDSKYRSDMRERKAENISKQLSGHMR